MIRQVVTIKNPTGLHLSPAGLLCKTAMQFECSTIFAKEKEKKNEQSDIGNYGGGYWK